MNFKRKNSQRVQNVLVILTVPPFLAMDGGEKWTESVISFLVMQFRQEVKCGSVHLVAKASFLFGARLLGLLFQALSRCVKWRHGTNIFMQSRQRMKLLRSIKLDHFMISKKY